MSIASDDTVLGDTGGTGTRFDAPPPKLADRYEMLGLLGVGGMGAVYLVRDTELDEVVALKMIRPEWSRDPAALERFRREVRLARRVTHANVARMFDIGDHQGEKFLTMEWIDGTSLAKHITDRVSGATEIVAIVQAICAGLGAAHAAGIVHRDLKPENVLFAKDGRVVVTDFGIAHAGDGDDEIVIGTPAYMAPEQLVPGSPIDHRADIYGLGAVLFEMLTGERAWKTARIGNAPPPDPRAIRSDVNNRLAEIAMRCMAVDPAARFQSAHEIVQLLPELASTPSMRSTRSTRSMSSPRVPKPSASDTTVAALPFANLGDEAMQFIADGLTGDLIDTLSMTRGLLVRPRSVTASFTHRERNARDIGRALDVDVILDGWVRRSGEALEIGMRLIGTQDGFQLWAKRFTTSLEQLLVTCDRAASEIANALTTSTPASAARASDPAAIELYLRAKQELWRSWSTTPRPAHEQFERALAIAPSDPRILAGTVLSLVRMLFFGEGGREANMARARELLDRAIVLAPDFGETWAALFGFRLNTGDAVGAARALRTGLDGAPNSTDLQESVGRLLAEITPLDEAIVRLELALDLDPSLLTPRIDLSRTYALLGDWDRARAVARFPANTLPYEWHLARLAVWRGEMPAPYHARPGSYGEIYANLDRAGLTDAQRDYMSSRARTYSGRIRLLTLQRNAELYCFFGETEPAITAIAEAVDEHLIDLAWLERCPILEVVRSDARFSAAHHVVRTRAAEILAALRGDGAQR